MSEQEKKEEYTNEPEEINIIDSNNEFAKENSGHDEKENYEIHNEDNEQKDDHHVDEKLDSNLMNKDNSVEKNFESNLNDLIISKDQEIAKLHLEIKEYQKTILLNEERIKKDHEIIDNLKKSSTEEHGKSNSHLNNEDYLTQITILNEEKTTLEAKVMKLKQNILEIKTKLESEINKKFEIKDIEINELKQNIHLNEKKIESLNKEILRLKKFEDHSKSVRAKYNQALIEKVELEDIIFQQDERINDLTSQLNYIENILDKKQSDLKKYDKNFTTLMKYVEDQKKSIRTLQTKLKKKEEEDSQKKILWAEKEQEIHFLKNFISSLKNETIMKEQNLNQMKSKLEKVKSDNKQLNSLINSAQTNNKKKKLENSVENNINRNSNENIVPNRSSKGVQNLSENFSMNDLDVNEINDENLKEITILMKKILDD